MRVTVIILAGGRGRRLKSRVSKPLVKVGRIPIIDYSLKVFNCHPRVKDIIIAVNSFNKKAISVLVDKSGYNKVKWLVMGGARRQDSVFNALEKVDTASDLVLIHDSARPFVKSKEISVLIAQAKRFGAAILGAPVKATIKQVARHKLQGTSFVVEKTLNREKLWEVQTPQAFRRDIIVKAYQKFGGIEVTDDAALIEKMGKPVVLVVGSYDNIKITTPEDLIIAEAILKSKKS